MKRLFFGEKAGSAIIIILFVVILWLPAFINQNPISFISDNNAQPLLISMINQWVKPGILLAKIISFIFLIIQAYILIQLNTRFILLNKRTFLPAFFYISIISFFPNLQGLTGPLFAALFLSLSINLIFDSYYHEKNSYRYFEAGLLIGLSSLFYGKMILLLPYIWICSMILRPFYWREWIMPITGAIVPFIFLSSVAFLFHNDPWSNFQILLESLKTDYLQINWNLSSYIFAGVLLILIILSSSYMLRIFQFRKIYIRNFYLSLFWLFVISILLIAISGFQDAGLIYFLAIPVSFILTNYFINSKKKRFITIMFNIYLFILIVNAVNNIFNIYPMK